MSAALSGSWGSSRAGAWNHLKAHSFMGLVVHAGKPEGPGTFYLCMVAPHCICSPEASEQQTSLKVYRETQGKRTSG